MYKNSTCKFSEFIFSKIERLSIMLNEYIALKKNGVNLTASDVNRLTREMRATNSYVLSFKRTLIKGDMSGANICSDHVKKDNFSTVHCENDHRHVFCLNGERAKARICAEYVHVDENTTVQIDEQTNIEKQKIKYNNNQKQKKRKKTNKN